MARNFIVTNSGKRVSDADAQRMVEAQLKETALFCAAWDLVMPTITYDATGVCVVPGNDVIDLGDQPPSDENGVLGFHTEVNGQKRGTIFAGYELDNGGKVLALDGTEPQGAATVASIFSHELFEQLVNGTVNKWWDGPITVKGVQYTSVAGETADPVEDGFPQAASRRRHDRLAFELDHAEVARHTVERHDGLRREQHADGADDVHRVRRGAECTRHRAVGLPRRLPGAPQEVEGVAVESAERGQEIRVM